MLESCKAGAEKQQNVEKRLNVLTISVFPNIITIKELGTDSGTGSGTKNNKNDNYMGKVMKNLTISQIAELAGVSKTTVSRVLNNKDDIKGETRERILQVIRENNYRPNSAARTINNRSTRTIGLLIPYQADYVLSNPFYYDVIRGITVEADLNDYYTLLMYSQKDSYLKTVREKRIDGLLLISFGTQHIKLLQELLETDIPMISLAKVPGFSTVPTVSVDDFDGAKKAVSHLIEQGHRDIAVINGPQTLVGHAERIKGYRAVLESHGIPYREELVLEREISVENGHLAMKKLLGEQTFTAAFICCDLMAIGAIEAIRDSGLRVPEDISIVGYDNIPMSGHLSPALTTVDQFAYKKGRRATQALIAQMEGTSMRRSLEIKPELVIRGSTARRPRE